MRQKAHGSSSAPVIVLVEFFKNLNQRRSVENWSTPNECKRILQTFLSRSSSCTERMIRRSSSLTLHIMFDQDEFPWKFPQYLTRRLIFWRNKSSNFVFLTNNVWPNSDKGHRFVPSLIMTVRNWFSQTRPEKQTKHRVLDKSSLNLNPGCRRLQNGEVYVRYPCPELSDYSLAKERLNVKKKAFHNCTP